MPTDTDPAPPARPAGGARGLKLAAPLLVGVLLAVLGLGVIFLGAWIAAACDMEMAYGTEGEVHRPEWRKTLLWEGFDSLAPLWLPIVAPLLAWAAAAILRRPEKAWIGAWVSLVPVVLWDYLFLTGGCVS